MQNCADNAIGCCLITANVGSIFENADTMIGPWIDELLAIVREKCPKFVALHCQEVGGKHYEQSMKHVEHFTQLLFSDERLQQFDRILMILDEDYGSKEHFTALGNLYFVREDVRNAFIWSFEENQFEPVSGKQIHAGSIEHVPIKDKSKFPQHFFPQSKWSRKGYLRTRWCLEGSIFDLVNIHLFHDVSNFIAMESFPSVYGTNRQRALQYVLDKFQSDDEASTVPLFLFGDFNFRTDTKHVIKELTDGLSNSNESTSKVNFFDSEQQLVLTLGNKTFKYEKQERFFTNPEWLKQFDKELEMFHEILTEFPIDFPPSYPFEEDTEKATVYMPTRCPAWCDRILLNDSATNLINSKENVKYALLGISKCMGDHKPVYLTFDLNKNHTAVQINVTECSSEPYYNRKSSLIKIDRKFLHGTLCTKDMLTYEPYTPDSSDSHTQSQSPFVFENGTDSRPVIVPTTIPVPIAVPADLLKERLESYLKSNCVTINEHSSK